MSANRHPALTLVKGLYPKFNTIGFQCAKLIHFLLLTKCWNLASSFNPVVKFCRSLLKAASTDAVLDFFNLALLYIPQISLYILEEAGLTQQFDISGNLGLVFSHIRLVAEFIVHHRGHAFR